MASLWQEARNAEGRVYYYNTETKATQWTKPEALMSASERALANQPWKEYTAEGGRKYWYNTETKVSSWEMPEPYKAALAESSSIPAKPPAPAQTFVAGGAASFPQYNNQLVEHDEYRNHDRGQDHQRDHERETFRSNFVPATANEPEFNSYDEAEAAFMKLLRRAGVEPGWSWEDAMKAVIKDPQYRAIRDPKDRKIAFEKYVVETREHDKERQKERLAKLRADFTVMLRRHPEIKHYTRWKTARPIIEGETIFRSTNDDTERRQLFEEYIVELKKAHAENEASNRRSALDGLVAILRELNLEPYTRWSEAQGVITSNSKFQDDEKYQALSKSDVLSVFENHIKSLERSFNDARQLEKTRTARRERINRDGFSTLLKELRSAGKIRAGTKWMDIHGLIEDEPRYLAMLGQAGSTPMDMFWDVVEDEERSLRGKRNEVLDVLDDNRFEVTPTTDIEEFMSVMKKDRRTSSLAPEDLSLIFARLHEKIVRRNEEDKHQSERQQRRAVDELRSYIKHLEPPVRVSDSWEDVEARISRSDEYKAISSSDARRSAFDKHIRRLKERELNPEPSERSRRGEHRDRNGHHSRHARPSRTPEPDAYEADRRKAQIDRERQYRKSSGTGLSPPPADRERDRERDRRRDSRDRRDRYDERDSGRRGRRSEYERGERGRDREDKERLLSRADPREGGSSELDYGDGGAASVSGGSRRRRDSEDEESVSARDAKRPRRGKARDVRQRTPAEPVTPVTSVTDKNGHTEKDDAAYKSGSEEGEIEEE